MIHYLKGDATQPIGNGTKIIAHVVNSSGGWGKGFVLAISNRWSEPERKYRAWHKSRVRFILGEVLFVKVSDDIIVANLLAQEGYSTSVKPAIRYDALKLCLEKVANKARKLSATVHCPRLSCGLAGGMWNAVEPIIIETMSDIDVFVYDL